MISSHLISQALLHKLTKSHFLCRNCCKLCTINPVEREGGCKKAENVLYKLHIYIGDGLYRAYLDEEWLAARVDDDGDGNRGISTG